MSRGERILVAVDNSELTPRTLENAIRYARADGWRIDLLYVLPGPLPTPTNGLPAAREILGDLAHREAAAAEKWLQELWEQIPEELRGEKLVRHGDAAERIVEEAGQGYQLVVLGTHGRTGLQHVLLGSVAEHVVRRAPIPVFVVR